MNWKQAFALGLIAPGAWDGGEQWETLWSGNVTTVFDNYSGNGAHCKFVSGLKSPLFNVGDTIKLTVNGESSVFSVDDTTVVGNYWLTEVPGHESHTDTGFNYAVYAEKQIMSFLTCSSTFYSRVASTYTIKLERKVV